jgi:hypothetical protein
MADSYYDMPSEMFGGEESSVDSEYLRGLLSQQKAAPTPTFSLPPLMLGGGVNNEIKLVVTDTDVQVDLNGNSFPGFSETFYGGAEPTEFAEADLLGHAEYFHKHQQGGFLEQDGGAALEDSYYHDPMSDTQSITDEKVRLFDYIDTVGEH